MAGITPNEGTSFATPIVKLADEIHIRTHRGDLVVKKGETRYARAVTRATVWPNEAAIPPLVEELFKNPFKFQCNPAKCEEYRTFLEASIRNTGPGCEIELKSAVSPYKTAKFRKGEALTQAMNENGHVIAKLTPETMGRTIEGRTQCCAEVISEPLSKAADVARMINVTAGLIINSSKRAGQTRFLRVLPKCVGAP